MKDTRVTRRQAQVSYCIADQQRVRRFVGNVVDPPQLAENHSPIRRRTEQRSPSPFSFPSFPSRTPARVRTAEVAYCVVASMLQQQQLS